MIGLVGCGRWGSKILRDLRALGREVGVVARSDESVGRARQGGAGEIWGSIEAMGEVEGVVVATPTTTHADVVAAVLDRDCPVFCEKPLTDDVIAARALAAQAPDRLFVMDKWRYHRGVEAIRDLVAGGTLGELQRLHVRFTSWSRPHADVDGLWVLMPHVQSIFLEVTGSIPPVDSASGWRVPGSRDVHVVAAYGGDGRCIAEVSTLRPTYERSATAIFDDAVVVLGGGYDEHLTVYRLGEAVDDATTVPFAAAMPLFDELQAFVEHLSGGPAPRSSAAEGLQNVERVGEVADLLDWGNG